ncbi:MAG: hypothetical protein JO188_19055 [Hyphomicrobiales bacterium]|nr:hypothetical protein [Hyphomicrobiales bacterium]
MSLPKGVFKVRKPSGRVYWFYQRGRGTAHPGPLVRLPDDERSPAFWRAVQVASGETTAAGVKGSFAALIAAYKNSPEWERLRPPSRKNYGAHLVRIDAMWGDLLAADLTARAVYAARDQMAHQAPTANHFLAALRTLLNWGVARDYAQTNVARDVAPLRLEPQTAQPWPEETYRFVVEHAPEDIRRLVILGRSTGQRLSDLVRMRPADRQENGLALRIGKLRDKFHWLPLTREVLDEIDSWGVARDIAYIISTAGNPYTANHMNTRWNRWRASEEAKPIRDVAITLHGLRASAVCDRRLDALTHQEISGQLCMSLGMVLRYSRGVDSRALGRLALEKQERGRNQIENHLRKLKTKLPINT